MSQKQWRWGIWYTNGCCDVAEVWELVGCYILNQKM